MELGKQQNWTMLWMSSSLWQATQDGFFLIPLYKRNKNDVSLLLVGEKTSLSGITPKGFSGAEMLCRVWQESAVQRGRTWQPT